MVVDSIIICFGLFVAFVIFFSVMYALNGLKISVKFSLSVVFCILCVLVGIHVFKQSKLNAYINEYELAFQQKEILICKYKDKEHQVSKDKFIYFPDMLLFMGKNDNKGIYINITDCTNHINIKDLKAQD